MAVPVGPIPPPPPPSSLAGIPPPPSLQDVNGKRKKKKRGKGKGITMAPRYDGDEDEDEDLPELEPVTVNGRGRSGSHTGLSPELESVHLSTTASLSASVAAAARLSPQSAAEAELLATADHLARSMEVDPEGMVNEEYWASFPDHLRNFVRHTYSQLSSPGNEAQKTQAMYAIAQQIHSGAGVNFTASATVKGTTRTTTARYPPGALPAGIPPAPPFDPSIFNEPAFAQAMAAAANGLQTRGMQAMEEVLEYGSEEPEYGDEDYYSEDEELDDGEGSEHDAGGVVGPPPKAAPTSRRKRKKNRRNKGLINGATPQTPVPPPAAPPARAASPNLRPAPASHPGMPAPRTTPAANPPPSSRAAGKQPMSYAQPAPANPPPQSRRAASKAPITSHAYPHNHTHHHPSPPSSNASQPHKHRPPANGTNSPAQVKNNKIWSTSTTEERERIKEFWLGLGEEDRRNLVKIEKEAVLRKMKEQQKHSCMCAVCGRKRSVLSILCPLFCIADLVPDLAP